MAPRKRVSVLKTLFFFLISRTFGFDYFLFHPYLNFFHNLFIILWFRTFISEEYIYSLSYDSEALPWPSRPWASSQNWKPMSFYIIITIFENFYKDAQGRDGYGNTSES